MTIGLLIELAVKSSLCAGLALLVLAIIYRRSAAEKSLVAYLGVLALLLLPAFILIAPRLQFETSGAFATMLSAVSEPVTAPTARLSIVPQGATPIRSSQVIAYAYLTGALLFLGGLVVALFRLRLIRHRAELLSDPQWLAALSAAQRRMNFKNGTALLTSRELSSPVSWGFMRPTIIVNSAAVEDRARAEAIIAHELAHVVRLDWVRLMFGRVVIALFWFNPLVWILVRRSHQLSEEAADDAVLRSDIASAEYADLLLQSMRHSERAPFFAANGVAPSASSLGTRIRHVLDGSRSRAGVRIGWSLACILSAGLFNFAIAAAQPVPAQYASPLERGAGDRAAAALDRLNSRQARTLANALRAKSWEARRSEGDTLIADLAAVQPLARALRDSDPRVRALAVWGLSEIRPAASSTAPQVAALLGDSSPQVRGQAARALGDFGASDYAEAVAHLLKDPNPDVREQAAHALGDLQVPATRGALEADRADPDGNVRAEVEWALNRVTEAERLLARGTG